MRARAGEEATAAGLDGVESSRGVLNAPVLWRWRRSKISCSSLGRRGGAGPELKGDEAYWGVVVKVRCAGTGSRCRRRRVALNRGFMVGCVLEYCVVYEVRWFG
jgi:hypothetical protein